jgi:hypothetical protein
VSVVEKAAQDNTAKAELFNNIKAIGGNIGGVAINMARQFIPGFA